MTSVTLVRYLIECDGCLAIFGDHDGFESSTEARAAAYGQGWRFPNRLKANGEAGSQASDVCPECLPGWKPQALIDKKRKNYGGRMLSKAEVAQLADGTAD
jgi:hypothetical protein